MQACTSSSSDATETIVVIRGDEGVMTKALKLHVKVESEGDDVARFDHAFEFPTWPQRVTLTPRNGDASRRFTLQAEATDSDGAPLGSLQLKTGFVAKHTRYAALVVPSDCRQNSPIELDPEQLATSADEISVDATAACQDLEPNMQPAAGSGGEPEAGRDPGPQAGQLSAGRTANAGEGGEGGKGGGGAGAPAARCGDGKLDPGEKCDPGIASGAGQCPKDCKSDDPCAVGMLHNSGCSAYCEWVPVSAAKNGDGCCPTAANAKDDDDCQPKCGNGVIEQGESCDPPSACTAAALCGALDKCMRAAISGEASKCTAACAPEPVKDCASGDGCCPNGCKRDQDQDCSPSCGDGSVDATLNETCEPTSTSQPCPTSCDDHDACTLDQLTGSAEQCSAACKHTPIASSLSAADGCCPKAADATTDSDCQPICGNGVLERGEDCDDHNTTGGDGCGATCKFDDDLRTPGDDRPHYFTCFDSGTCGPNTRCCLPPPPDGAINTSMCVEEAQCARLMHDCDGPEDCAAGQQCWSTGCRAVPSSKDLRVACHTNADCATATCSGGMTVPCPVCSAQGSCEAGAMPSR